MLGLSTPIIAAAWLLLGQPGLTGPPVQVDVQKPFCQLTMDTNPPRHGNHISVRWVGWRHHHHHSRRRGHGG